MCDGRGDGRKRPRRKEGNSTEGEELGSLIVRNRSFRELTTLYRWLPRGKPIDRNENYMSKYSWFEESMGCEKASTYAEDV